MTQPPDNPTQPIATGPTSEQPAMQVPAVDAAAPAWATAAHEGDGTASARPMPVAGGGVVPSPLIVSPATSSSTASPGVPGVGKTSWSSRMGAGRGLAVGALVVGVGLGAVVGSGATWALTSDGRGPGIGSVADGEGHGRFDHDRDGDFGPGGRGEMPPGGQLPNGQLPNGQLPGGGAGTDDDPDSGATGTSQAI